MKTSKIVLIFVIIIVNEILAAPFDTGNITWHQPNGVTFVARSWGDEFENWMETDNGYRIINGPNQYFYYAVLDSRGEFYPSIYKVGINKLLSTSYLLERTQDRIQQIEQERIEFNEQIQVNFNTYINDPRFNGYSTQPMHLAIVLVDFTPTIRQNYYTKAAFDTLFFSTNYYISPDASHNPRSPDLEQVFGSFRDYFLNQSLGRLNIIGKFGTDRSIINPPDPNNQTKPKWVIMPNSRSYYDNNFSKTEVMAIVKTVVETQLSVDLDLYDKIGFIYAGDGNIYHGGTEAGGGTNFSSDERYKTTFSHIGITAHEFAHTLGAGDEYWGEVDPHFWSLMATGLRNGPSYTNIGLKGNCPAPFSPAYRIKFNWVVPQLVQAPVNNMSIGYSDIYPIFYRVNIPSSDEYFIIERRRKNGFDRYTPSKEVENISSPPPGILIWHIAPSAPLSGGEYSDLEELEFADNNYDWHNDRFPYPPYPNTSSQSFSHLSLPSSNKRNGDNSFISINNIEWIGDQQTGHAELDYIFEALEITGTQTWSTTMYLALPVYIRDGGTLNIINGADVYINGDFAEQVKIVVEDGGTLNLLGSENNKVVLRTGEIEQPIQKWFGIEIHGNGVLESDFAVIMDALNPITVFQDYASCSLNNTEIVGNTVILSGNVTIENSIFSGASLDINKSNNGSKIKRTLFSSELPNELYVLLSYPGVSYLEVANCTFDGMNYGLVFGIDDPEFGDRTNQITVRNNIFSNCNRSVELFDGGVSISFNNFYNNNYDDFMGSNYLTVNPLYIEPGNNDFNIQWGSGCIDAGHTSTVYNDPDGTRNDMGAKYYDQSPIVPANFTLTEGTYNHPLLDWDGAPHLSYKVYALYEYYTGNSSTNEYTTLTESYLDETVIIVEPHGQIPNQVVTYSVTSINSIDEESEHTDEISIDAFGRISKQAFIDSSIIPVSYNLFNPYPNPFNPSTTIVFDLPENSHVTLKVYNVTGEEINTLVNNTLSAGRHRIVFEGKGIPSGIYFVRIVTKDYISTKKVILMK